MDPATDLALTFGKIIGRNTYEWATHKLRNAREAKTLEEQKEIYDEIVETLLDEKSDLQNVARQYKDLYEQISITSEDIDLLKNTIRRVVELFNQAPDREELIQTKMNETGFNRGDIEIQVDRYLNKQKEQAEKVEQFIALVDNDTLQTMQLLGFNYKEAIGKPLTEVCSDFIYSKLGNQNYRNEADESGDDK
ncbi:uncharacterized membrane-anchored protein YhcB (DUF1043 family) [Geomicrobium halophilum]|uniref:Uncharacterized membrane-anchored protein YhcB (DUF1043 family) n=1 Tax=Geomicrobium halophilum TaxID=549000 RepID=A0A841PQW3_9BACL|nr:hypothetical protein [Geomicrobium halophilum]MBB6451180.1 uncharacterized membrane-anchored protein YhcB (DUF1043 family) [Geomicrobium halophilum]